MNSGPIISQTRQPTSSKMLVLSPTRELAQQIMTEAQKLCTYHTNMRSILLVGGTNMKTDVRNLSSPFSVIIATPGRLLAHLQETPGFSELCLDIELLILDEADRLLDMGFQKDIDSIIRFLDQRKIMRHQGRQTLLFSATVPKEVRTIANTFLNAGFVTIDAVGEEEEQTHSHVHQTVMIVPMDLQLRVIIETIEKHIRSNSDYKIVVFFATARQTGYYAKVLNSVGLSILEMHSRKSQSHRTKVSDTFR
jgi:ATP-dependent RNA helicase MSS116